jgi:hypothetical protein
MHHRNLGVAAAIGALGLGIIVAKHHNEPPHPAMYSPVAPPTNPAVEYDHCVTSAWSRLRQMCGDAGPMAQCLMAAHSTVATAACCDDVDRLTMTCRF